MTQVWQIQKPAGNQEDKVSRDVPCVWNLKRNDTRELIYKTDSQTQRTNLSLPIGTES